MRKLLTICLFLLTNTCFAQKIGYLGKTWHLSAGVNLNPLALGYNTKGQTLVDLELTSKPFTAAFGFGFNPKLEFNLRKSFGPSFAISLFGESGAFGSYSTVLGVYDYTSSYLSFDQITILYKNKVNRLGINFELFHTQRKGSIAPIGFHTSLGLGYNMIQSNFVRRDFGYNRTGILIDSLVSKSKNFTSTFFQLENGKNIVVGDYFTLEIGLRLRLNMNFVASQSYLRYGQSTLAQAKAYNEIELQRGISSDLRMSELLIFYMRLGRLF